MLLIRRGAFLFFASDQSPDGDQLRAALTVSLVAFSVWKEWTESSDLATAADTAREAELAHSVSLDLGGQSKAAT